MRIEPLEVVSKFQKLFLSLVYSGLLFFIGLLKSRRNKLSINPGLSKRKKRNPKVEGLFGERERERERERNYIA
jgi:hypothetical protein